MDVNVSTVEGVNVVALVGELDASTSVVAREHIMPLATAGAQILIDMSGVSFMSSAGLRLLLGVSRQVTAEKGQVALAGLSENLLETMSAVGFLTFFTVHPSAAEGVRAMRSKG